MAQILKEEIRLSILASAKKSFMQSGYEQCTVRQIAKGAGITVGNLYRYFENKEAIYDEIIKSVIIVIDRVILQKSEGKISFFIAPIPPSSDKAKQWSQQIVEGIFLLLPMILENYKSEVLILLKFSERAKETKVTFDFLGWVATYMEALYAVKGAGKHFTFALLKGIESIIEKEQDLKEAQKQLEYFIKSMLSMGGKLK